MHVLAPENEQVYNKDGYTTNTSNYRMRIVFIKSVKVLPRITNVVGRGDCWSWVVIFSVSEFAVEVLCSEIDTILTLIFKLLNSSFSHIQTLSNASSTIGNTMERGGIANIEQCFPLPQ